MGQKQKRRLVKAGSQILSLLRSKRKLENDIKWWKKECQDLQKTVRLIADVRIETERSVTGHSPKIAVRMSVDAFILFQDPEAIAEAAGRELVKLLMQYKGERVTFPQRKTSGQPIFPNWAGSEEFRGKSEYES